MSDIGSIPTVEDGNYFALSQIVEQRRTQLLRIAERMTDSREDAEDVVQESILKAFSSLHRFRGDSQLGTWLYAIVLNTGRSWLRSQRGREIVSLETIRRSDGTVQTLELPHPGQSPEESCVEHELQMLLNSEIGKLNPVYRSVLQMCCFQGYSYQEASHALQTNVASTKARLARSKKLLRKRILPHTSTPIHASIQ